MVTHGPRTATSSSTHAYVGFLLPLLIELQHLEARDRP